MTLIHVPRPSKKAMNPDRPVSSLLLAQIQHLRIAEHNLPLRYRSDKYVKAIQTEREAAAYIREVTEAIHQAHEDAAAERAKRAPTRKKGLALAAAAQRPLRKRSSRARTKISNRKRGKK
jgi:hypothetical protein